MSEIVERGIDSTIDKATVAWIEYKKQIRTYDLLSRLTQQDKNLEQALMELSELKVFISDPSHCHNVLV